MANVYTLKQLTDAVRQVESGGEKDPKRAINPESGARGDMQVMPGTLYKPGYGVTAARDDSPEEASRVGRDYLKAMVGRFGQEAGLVAYNWGPTNAKKWIKGGRDKNKLPGETRNYLVKVNNILAGSTKGRRKTTMADRYTLKKRTGKLDDALVLPGDKNRLATFKTHKSGGREQKTDYERAWNNIKTAETYKRKYNPTDIAIIKAYKPETKAQMAEKSRRFMHLFGTVPGGAGVTGKVIAGVGKAAGRALVRRAAMSQAEKAKEATRLLRNAAARARRAAKKASEAAGGRATAANKTLTQINQAKRAAYTKAFNRVMRNHDEVQSTAAVAKTVRNAARKRVATGLGITAGGATTIGLLDHYLNKDQPKVATASPQSKSRAKLNPAQDLEEYSDYRKRIFGEKSNSEAPIKEFGGWGKRGKVKNGNEHAGEFENVNGGGVGVSGQGDGLSGVLAARAKEKKGRDASLELEDSPPEDSWRQISGPTDWSPGKRTYKTPFGVITIGEDPKETARKDREFEETNYKKGGQVKKGLKKTKTRKARTRPRGVGAAKRGWGKAMSRG